MGHIITNRDRAILPISIFVTLITNPLMVFRASNNTPTGKSNLNNCRFPTSNSQNLCLY